MDFKDRAKKDFDKMRFKSIFSFISSLIFKKPIALYNFHEFRKISGFKNEFYKGIKSIDLDLIIGSENRYRDFDKYFFPKHVKNRERWENIDIAHYQDKELPIIQLYKIGKFYFIKDGNHRVSVAKALKKKYIDAEIIEIIPEYEGENIEEIIKNRLKEEKKNFFNLTKLNSSTNSFDISFIGGYDILLDHINKHKYYMGIEKNQNIEFNAAVEDWFEKIYFPVILVIRQNKILNFFPGHTETELYIWIMEHWHYIKEEYGNLFNPEIIISDFKIKYSPQKIKILYEKYFKPLT